MTSAQRNTFIAAFLGWTLDAFDFFLVIVVVPHLAHDFGKSVVEVGLAITLTLAMRPLGALIFGWFADRYGRRIPLMIDVGFFALIEALTAFSPNFAVFLVLRITFGVAMGGEWGLGSALAMESLPADKRGFFSGLLQEGYAVGNLLAGLTLALLYTHIGWRGMFLVGALPALLALFIRARVPESPVWKANAHHRLALKGDVLLASLRRSWPLFLYGMTFMATFNFMSHGTQDVYATFLTSQRGFDPTFTGTINAIAALGAIGGGLFFGWLSQKLGRRWTIVICALLGLALVPAWAFSHTAATLALGGFAMQFAVQGAWGIIPAHLNEISPPEARGTFPGFTYQLGNLIASATLQIEAALAIGVFALPNGHANYATAMAVFSSIVFIAVIVMTLLGNAVVPENRTADFAVSTVSE